MGRVIIGMDPHKRSATIEIIDDRETVLAGGRFGTDGDGYRSGYGRWKAATASVGTSRRALRPLKIGHNARSYGSPSQSQAT